MTMLRRSFLALIGCVPWLKTRTAEASAAEWRVSAFIAYRTPLAVWPALFAEVNNIPLRGRPPFPFEPKQYAGSIILDGDIDAHITQCAIDISRAMRRDGQRCPDWRALGRRITHALRETYREWLMTGATRTALTDAGTKYAQAFEART
jgi:hypothetical protein